MRWRSRNSRRSLQPRPARASKPENASLAALPPEIWASIAGEIVMTSPESAATACLLNWQFWYFISEALHRDLAVDLAKHTTECLRRHCSALEARSLLTVIQRLSITGNDPHRSHNWPLDERMGSSLAMLADFCSRMSALREIVFRGSRIPLELLDVVRAQPRVGLDIRLDMWALASAPGQDQRLEPLIALENLASLDITFGYLIPLNCKILMDSIKAVLLSAENLQTLRLDVRQPDWNTEMEGSPWPYRGFGFLQGDRLPRLKTLELLQYPFGHEPSSRLMPFDDWSTEGFPRSGQEIDHWADILCWSDLTSFKTLHADLALRVMPQLTALQTFSYTEDAPCYMGPSRTAEITELLLQIPAQLKSIRTPTLAHGSLEGVLRHSDTLCELEIHQSDIKRSNWCEQAISVYSLSRIRDECRRITELTIDIARQDNWPYAAFDVLASFKSVRRTAIWFKLCQASPYASVALMNPELTAESAGQVVNYITSECEKQHDDKTSLESLDLRSGGSYTPIGSYCCLGVQKRTMPSSRSFYFGQKSGRDPGAGRHLHEATGSAATTHTARQCYCRPAPQKFGSLKWVQQKLRLP